MSTPPSPPSLMTRDELSQLTLPQIASAVAAGEARIEDAEAELRRRPAEPRREMRRFTPRPPAKAPPAADLAKLVEETRRELHQTTRRLAQLGKRLDMLAQLAETPAPAPARPPRRRRPAAHRDDSSLMLLEDDDATEAA